jgi:hypothetical protein
MPQYINCFAERQNSLLKIDTDYLASQKIEAQDAVHTSARRKRVRKHREDQSVYDQVRRSD